MASLSTAFIASTKRSARSFGAPLRDAIVEAMRLRRKPRAKQRLADVDIAEPGDDALIQQRRLEACFLALAGARQHGGVEFITERLRAQSVEQRFGVELAPRHDLHEAEAARIVEGRDRSRGHVKDDVVVGDVLRALVIVVAPRFRLLHPRHGRLSHQTRRTSPTCRDASAAHRRMTSRRADIWRAGPCR